MREIIMKPDLYRFDTFEAFRDGFEIGEGDPSSY